MCQRILITTRPKLFSTFAWTLVFFASTIALAAGEEELKAGLDLYSKGDYASALLKWRDAAGKGNAAAMSHIGSLYRYGRGVKQDYIESMRWYRKAADEGNTAGMFNIGAQYEWGQGVEEDYAEAMRWYRKAADKGNADGMVGIGGLYFFGECVKQDFAVPSFAQIGQGPHTRYMACTNADRVARCATYPHLLPRVTLAICLEGCPLSRAGRGDLAGDERQLLRRQVPAKLPVVRGQRRDVDPAQATTLEVDRGLRARRARLSAAGSGRAAHCQGRLRYAPPALARSSCNNGRTNLDTGTENGGRSGAPAASATSRASRMSRHHAK